MLRPIWRLFDFIRARVFRRALTPAHALGRIAEDLAHRYLEDRGYEVIDRNWFDRRVLSEIDLVARHEGRLVFIEVKARSSDDFAAPERALHRVKRAALERGILRYALRARAKREDLRFDVLTVVFTDPPRITLYKDEPIRPPRRRNAVC